MSEIRMPLEMLDHWTQRFPDQIYLRQSTGTDWIEYSWRDVSDRVRRIASYLREQDYPSGSNIAIWSTNSADWFLVDLAIVMAGHVTVPIYPAQDAETAGYILRHSESRLLFAGSFQNAEGLDEILPSEVKTVGMRGVTVETDTNLDSIIDAYEPRTDFKPRKLDDLATIIYSSGTSGQPKGVMHTFRSVSQAGALIAETYRRLHYQSDGDDRERIISYLPLAHAAERALVETACLYTNSLISISAGLDSFSSELQVVRPTFFGAVPRIWYKFKEGVEAMLAATGKKIETEAEKAMVRETLGLDAAQNSITGSAPVSPQVHSWYADIGIPLRESYSLTETFAHGTYWDSSEPCPPGCVGRACKGVEVKLDEDDQILFKSPTLMKGYYKNETLTEQVIRDGWFATGDLGRFDEKGNLWLTGRVGSVFKSGKGKFIHPERLEHILNRDPWVEQAMVFGSGMAQPVAVVSIGQHLHGKTDTELQTHFESARNAMNADLPAYEKVSGMLVVRDVWDAESGELTPTLKIRRKIVAEKYAGRVDEDTPGAIVAGS